MESIVDEEEKKMSESDSDVSVTVDESGSAIQNQIHVSHAHSISPTAVSLIAQAQVQAQVQPVKPLPSVPSCTQKVLVKPSITLVDSTRPTNLLASRPVSVDDTKHKSFASKLSAFLQRKPSHYHSNSGSSSTSTTQPAAIPDQVVIVIEENDDTPIEAYLTPLGPDDENQLLMDHEMTVDQCLVIRPETNNVLNTMKTSKSSLADFMEISNVINNVVAENKTEHGTQL